MPKCRIILLVSTSGIWHLCRCHYENLLENFIRITEYSSKWISSSGILEENTKANYIGKNGSLLKTKIQLTIYICFTNMVLELLSHQSSPTNLGFRKILSANSRNFLGRYHVCRVLTSRSYPKHLIEFGERNKKSDLPPSFSCLFKKDATF